LQLELLAGMELSVGHGLQFGLFAGMEWSYEQTGAVVVTHCPFSMCVPVGQTHWPFCMIWPPVGVHDWVPPPEGWQAVLDGYDLTACTSFAFFMPQT